MRKYMKGNDAARRLQNIILQDKICLPCGFDDVIRQETERALSCYMTLCGPARVCTDVDDRGIYRINISLTAVNIVAPQSLYPGGGGAPAE